MSQALASLSRRGLLRSGALLGGGALAGGLLPAFPGWAQAGAEPGALWPATRRLVRRYVDSRRVAGMVATVGIGQGRPDVIAAGTHGFHSQRPVDADSLFRIYSMTKPITGMATMLCIEDGLLGLDQPLAEILPGFARMQVQRVYDGPITPDNLVPAVRPITIRHLLTHTAGLGYTIVQQGPIREAYNAAGIIPGRITRLQLAQVLFGGTPAPSLAAFADNLARLPLVGQPGERWRYSVSLDLLGRVIEVVSGQPFDRFLQERIFAPCGMDSTFFRVPASEAARLTTSYLLLNGNPLPIDPGESSVFLDEPAFPFGGAGLVSSPRDYDRFLMMLAGWGRIDGRRVMSEPAVRLATSDLLPETLAADGGFSTGGRAFGYGAGGMVGRGEAAGLFGWFGAAGTAGLVNLRHGIRHNLMTQYLPAESLPVQTEFTLAVAEDSAALLARR